MRTVTTAGDAGSQAGMAAHLYLATRSMEDEYFYNADGEMLVVPQQGDSGCGPSSASSTSGRARSRSSRAA
jgi:homogentisate 1,2-dioxygenase